MAQEGSNPITDADIQRLLDEEQANDKEAGWKQVNKTELVETWRKTVESQTVHLIKGYLKFPGIPVDAVFELSTNPEIRMQWDKTFPHIEVVEETADYKIIYWQCSMPAGVTDRDLLQYMKVKKIQETQTTVVVYKDAKHPKVPEKKGFIRSETILSGLVIRPDPDDPQHSTTLSMLVQSDAKGRLPKFVVNFASSKAPEEWRGALTKYYTEVHTKK